MKFFIKLFAVYLLAIFVVQSSSAAEDGGVALLAEQRADAINDLNYLLQRSVPKINEQLSKEGDFYPFGAATFPSGDVKFVWIGKKNAPNKPKPEIAIAAVRQALESNASQNALYSTAVFYVTGVENKKTGKLEHQLVAELEHHLGVAIVRVVKYTVENGEMVLGVGTEQEQPVRIFKPI